jgi:hypothetical protein
MVKAKAEIFPVVLAPIPSEFPDRFLLENRSNKPLLHEPPTASNKDRKPDSPSRSEQPALAVFVAIVRVDPLLSRYEDKLKLMSLLFGFIFTGAEHN